MKKKILIAITGASGSIYAAQIIDKLMAANNQWQELSVVVTSNAMDVWKVEMKTPFQQKPGIRYFDKNDFAAPFASGSGQYGTMIIIPCSMGVLGRIANGISNDLITRAADVILKERRKLICVVRETPYHLIHIQNMERITLAGGIICPATPSFYSQPQTIEELTATVTDRVLDLAGISVDSFRWGTTQ